MEHKIKLLPGEQSIQAQSEETILDTLLAAGVAAKYNCSNGSCGQCRAKLISGEFGQQHHHDYVFSAQEKTEDYFLMCRCHPGSDMEIEVDLFSGVEDVPEQEIQTKVYRISDPRPDFRVVELRTPRSQTLQFLPGQHLELSVDGLEPVRKPIASCPCNGRYLQLHFYRHEKSELSEYVFEQLSTRTAVNVQGPYGRFTFDELSDRPVVFIATSTGFAAIKSLIEHVISLEVKQPLHLFWCVKKEGDDYLSNYCRSWLATEDNFIYTRLSLQEAGISEELTSMAAQDYFAAQIGAIYHDLSGHDIYFSGPKSDYAAMIFQLRDYGVESDRLFIDEIKPK